MTMKPKQHREHAAELIIERARYSEQPSVLKYLEAEGVEHTVEDAKAIFALIGAAAINVWFPGDRAHMSHPYARALLAEIDKLNAELGEAMSILAKVGDAISPTGERPEEALGTLADDVRTVVNQRDAARVEIEHLRAQLGQAVDVVMANGWKQEADRLDEANAAQEAIAAHPWQEYNEHGYLCHYPGCQKAQDEHAEFVPRLTPFASGGPVRGPGTRDDDRVPFPLAGCLHSEICVSDEERKP